MLNGTITNVSWLVIFLTFSHYTRLVVGWTNEVAFAFCDCCFLGICFSVTSFWTRFRVLTRASSSKISIAQTSSKLTVPSNWTDSRNLTFFNRFWHQGRVRIAAVGTSLSRTATHPSFHATNSARLYPTRTIGRLAHRPGRAFQLG